MIGLLVVAMLSALIPAIAQATPAHAAPSQTSASAQLQALDPGCASGPRIDTFLRSMTLLSASTGWSFRPACGEVVYEGSGATRQGTLVVKFRDRDKHLRYVGWYDSTLDRAGKPLFSGGWQMGMAKVSRDGEVWGPDRLGDWLKRAYRYARYNAPQVNPGLYIRAQAEQYFDIEHRNKCEFSPGFTRCRGGQDFSFNQDYYHLFVSIGASDDFTIKWSEYLSDDPSWFESLIRTVLMTAVGAMIGHGIGLALGASGAALTAIRAGVGTFVSGLIQGKDPGDAFLDGLKAGAKSYVGSLIKDKFGKFSALVGIEGTGCSGGGKCWYLKLLDNLPSLTQLAKLHDAFTVWSQKAWASVDSQPWYQAVTIPSFRAPGCTASNCVTAGVVIGTEDELSGDGRSNPESEPLYQTYHAGSTDHFSTRSSTDRAAALRMGFADVGVVGYLPAAPGPATAPLYRLYRGDTVTAHFYTADPSKRREVVSRYGFTAEGTEGYVFTTQVTGTEPLYQLSCKPGARCSQGGLDFRLIRGDSARDTALAGGWTLKQKVGYVWPTPR